MYIFFYLFKQITDVKLCLLCKNGGKHYTVWKQIINIK